MAYRKIELRLSIFCEHFLLFPSSFWCTIHAFLFIYCPMILGHIHPRLICCHTRVPTESCIYGRRKTWLCKILTRHQIKGLPFDPIKKKKGLPFEFVRTKLFLIWSLPLGHVSLTFQHKLKVWKIISYFVVYDAVFTCFTLTIYFIVNLISGFTMNLIRVNTTFRISYFVQNLISWS